MSKMHALILFSLLTLLSGCGSMKNQYILTPSIPIPVHLLNDCELPIIPEELTWRDTTLLLIDAMKSINQCNLDKGAIRKIEEQRRKIII
nr:peptidase [uncultured Moellerella sp.]